MEQDVGTKSTMCTKQFTEKVLHQSTVVQLMLVTKLNVMLCSLHVLWFFLFYSCTRFFSVRGKDGQIDTEQKGVFRTNCIDSLDR